MYNNMIEVNIHVYGLSKCNFNSFYSLQVDFNLYQERFCDMIHEIIKSNICLHGIQQFEFENNNSNFASCNLVFPELDIWEHI